MLKDLISNHNKFSEIKQNLLSRLQLCDLCPRKCKVDRIKGETGFCKTGSSAKVNSAFLHFGEEPEITGKTGSGTIFFSHCNLECCFCQNYTISHQGQGREVNSQELAQMMLALQRQGAQNLNFVTPTHVTAQIVEAIFLLLKEGLDIPLVYNCGGYESIDTLKSISGIFDIYMPDLKYSNNNTAKELSSAPDYWQISKEALIEMHRQVGDLIVEGGAARGGLLVRHLVLPNNLSGTFEILDFIKNELSIHTYVNIMDQYRPCYNAHKHKGLDRRITPDEYSAAVSYARNIGLYRGFNH
ncbi:MAG: radical SAM protein [Candidatus Omnitrophota bacterium]